MKNSPPPLPLSPSSSSSSSSSSSNASTLFSSNVLHVNKPKKKPKPSKKDANQDKRHLGDGHGNVNGKRSSAFRGVTRHRWTGRYEAHLWDKHGWNYVQNKKGRQVYLGAYDDEEAAARTYDLAALKYWGEETALNFPIDTYTKEYEEMQSMSKEEYLASLRRRSNGFSIGVCKYRGVARHHYNGRWEARIGTVFGNKFLYLGTFSTQEGAVQACDLAAIEYRGPSAVTNFDISCYIKCPQPLQKPHLPHKPKSQSPQVQEQPGTCEEAQATEVSNRFGPSTIADDNGVDEIPWSPFMDQCFNDVHPDHHIAFHRSNDPHDYCGSVGFEDDVDFLLGMSEYSNRDETEGVDEARKDCMFEDAAAEREKEDMAYHMNTVPFRPHSISICS